MRNFLALALGIFLVNVYVPETQASTGTIFAPYQEMFSIPPQNVLVPTVVEVPLWGEGPFARHNILVVESATGAVTNALYIEGYNTELVPITISTNHPAHPELLTDGSMYTGVRYELDEAGEGYAQIMLTATKPVRASSLQLTLGSNVALPESITIRARGEDGVERIVLSASEMRSELVTFIPTEAREWTIEFKYTQPLQINELILVQDDAEQTADRAVRFLAQPGVAYTVYINADRPSEPYIQNQNNLTDNEGVLYLDQSPTFVPNPFFVPADSDDDGVPDISDNCAGISNRDQLDINQNRKGDACEDFDRDGIMNNTDNCKDYPNRDQRDTDGDGMGDVCDGEESRLTERLPWVPWAGMGIAALVLITLFAIVAQRPIPSKEQDQSETNT